MDSETSQSLRESIEQAIGAGRPYVLIYDDTPISNMLDDELEEQNSVVTRLTPKHQSTITTVGILEIALGFLEGLIVETDDDEDDEE